jgi:Flp pilus assembly protein TadD
MPDRAASARNHPEVSFMFQRRTLLAVLPLVLAASCAALGQQIGPTGVLGSVRGQVRFAVGGEPAERVLVRLEKFGGGVVAEVMTDRTGKFDFEQLQREHYEVTTRLAGFLDQSRDVDLTTTTTDYILFRLVEDKSAPPTVLPPKLVDASVPDEARKEYEKGSDLVMSGKGVEEGVRHLTNAVRIYPKFFEAELVLGTSYMDLRQWDKAEQALRSAAEINPNSPATFFALGELYLQQKRYDEAEKPLRAGLGLDNHSWQGHFGLARVYWAKDDVSKAAQQTAITLQLNPNFADAHLLAGNIWLRAGRRAEAVPEFEEYLRLSPNGQFAAQARDSVQKIKAALAKKP